MLTIIPNPKAMNYDKLIDFLNKRKNIELNRFKQRDDKNIKDIEYRINKKKPTDQNYLNYFGIAVTIFIHSTNSNSKKKNIRKTTQFRVRFKNS